VGAKPDAKFGIFLSPDPIGPLNGGSTFGNRYAYVGYDPINFVDPTGFSRGPGVDCLSYPDDPACQGGEGGLEEVAEQTIECFVDGWCGDWVREIPDWGVWDEIGDAGESIANWGIWDGNFTGPKSPPKPHIAATSDGQAFGVTGSTGSSGGTTPASGGSGTPGSGVSASSNPIPPPPGWLFGLNPPVAFQWQFAHDGWNVADPETSTGDRVQSALVLGVQFTPWGKLRGAFGGVTESFAASRSMLARVGLVAGVDLGGGAAGGAALAARVASAAAQYPKQVAQALRMNPQQLQRSIRSFDDNIAEHQAYLRNPQSHVPNWSQLSQQHQQNLIHHWNADIARAEKYRAIAEGVLKGLITP
jgi:hypothetical protein